MAAPSKRILVVDDEPLICELLRDALQLAGHVVCSVGSGEDALTATLESEFDVALIDIRLPGMDGVSVLEELTKRSVRPAVLLMTAYPDTSTEGRLAALAFEGFLRKPFTLLDVVRMVDSLPPCSSE